MSFEEELNRAIDQITDSRTREAMRYSLLAGGKRIRPSLLFLALKGYGKDEAEGLPFAIALEMIHTYSLIHDDLPAMDNDDLRRGRPTCHRQFDEATAILAGDGLLTYAFTMASGADVPAEKKVKCISILAEMAGPDGMVYGQTLDMAEDSTYDFEALKKVHKYKTGCLLSAPLMMAAVLADQEDAVVEHWHEIGDTIGLAFQVQDDILDVLETPEQLGKSNSDERNEKVTSVSLLGLDKAEQLMDSLYEESEKEIEEVRGFEGKELVDLIQGIATRKK